MPNDDGPLLSTAITETTITLTERQWSSIWWGYKYYAALVIADPDKFCGADHIDDTFAEFTKQLGIVSESSDISLLDEKGERIS